MLRLLSKQERLIVWSLALIGFASRVALVFRTDWEIATRPYIEDAFYALSCARQLALGHGFSIDGIHPTNGVQPLICLLDAPCFWFSDDRWVGVRLTLVLAGVIQLLCILVLARLLAQIRVANPNRVGSRAGSTDPSTSSGQALHVTAPIVGAFVWAIAAPLLVHNVNGLETGLYALCILICLSVYHSILNSGWSTLRAIAFGVLLGLTVLARIDAVLFVASFAAWELWRGRTRAIQPVLTFGLIALAVSAPWWLYNYHNFGSLMPISGQSEGLGKPIVENLLQSAAALFDMLTVFFYHRFYSWDTWVTVAALAGIAIIWGYFATRFRVAATGLRAAQSLTPVVLFSLALLLYYNFFFSAPHFLARYLHPVRILALIGFCMALPSLLVCSGRICRVGIYFWLLAGTVFGAQRYLNDFTGEGTSDFYAMGQWANKHAGRIGMGQSGTAGFIASNIVNLDGKVNPDALRARKSGRIGEYIAREHIEYLADWLLIVDPLVRAAHDAGVEYQRVDSVGYLLIYRRVN